jgi:hypothetical protein
MITEDPELEQRSMEKNAEAASGPGKSADAGFDPSDVLGGTAGPTERTYPGGYPSDEDAVRAQRRYGGEFGSFGPNPAPEELRLGDFQLEVRGPGNRGLLPSVLRDSEKNGTLQDSIYSMSAVELADVQKKLWLSGYYGDEAIYGGRTPKLGVPDAETVIAWQDFLDDGIRNSGERTLEDLLVSRLGAYRRVHAEAAQAANESRNVVEIVPNETISLTDPATITLAAQDFAQANLGRRLTEAEMSAVVAVASSAEAAPQRAIAARDRAQSLAAINAQYQDTGVGLPSLDTVIGGGPDSEVIGLGHHLAATHGLAVVSDFRSPDSNHVGGTARDASHERGLGFDMVGDEEDVAAFEAWASSSGLIEKVERRNSDQGEEAHLHVTLKEGAEIPPELRSGAWMRVDREEQMEAFLSTIKRPGEDYAYRTSETPTGVGPVRDRAGQQPVRGRGQRNERRALGGGVVPEPELGQQEYGVGAFEIPARVIRQYQHQFRLKDWRTESSQHLIARAYAHDLYTRYEDWRLVSIAWKYGTAVGDRFAETSPITQGAPNSEALNIIDAHSRRHFFASGIQTRSSARSTRSASGSSSRSSRYPAGGVGS